MESGSAAVFSQPPGQSTSPAPDALILAGIRPRTPDSQLAFIGSPPIRLFAERDYVPNSGTAAPPFVGELHHLEPLLMPKHVFEADKENISPNTSDPLWQNPGGCMRCYRYQEDMVLYRSRYYKMADEHKAISKALVERISRAELACKKYRHEVEELERELTLCQRRVTAMKILCRDYLDCPDVENALWVMSQENRIKIDVAPEWRFGSEGATDGGDRGSIEDEDA